jgi:hypothetical protein
VKRDIRFKDVRATDDGIELVFCGETGDGSLLLTDPRDAMTLADLIHQAAEPLMWRYQS